MTEYIINCLLHFIGAFTIYCAFERTEWLKPKMAAKVTFVIAVFFELGQVDMWQSINGLNKLLNYYWIDTAFDLILAVLGIATAMLLSKKITE